MTTIGVQPTRRSWEPWLIWVVAVALQAGATIAAFNRLWYEELAESVRNPFWLDQHAIYDGASSNVGWYGLCLATYKLFGFSLATAKILRLVLHALSWFCLLSMLRRALPGRSYILPALAIALSPTLLYFNTFQGDFGGDLQFAPIVLWCVLQVSPKRPLRAAAYYAGAGMVTMLAAMAYPSTLVYLPCLLALVVWIHWRWLAHLGQKQSWVGVSPVLAAPLAGGIVLLAGFLSVHHPRKLILDPHNGGGIFRGGGGQISWAPDSIMAGVHATLDDLFVTGKTYYFALKDVEFDGTLGLIACALTIGAGLLLLTRRTHLKVPTLIAFGLMGAGLFLVNLSSQYPGLRRCTSVVFAFYSLLILACVCAVRAPAVTNLPLRLLHRGAFLAAAVLVVHHAVGYPGVIRELQSESEGREFWLQSAPTPDAALRQWAQKAAAGEVIACGGSTPGALTQCRFSEFYAAVAGLEKWSHGRDTPVRILDPKTGRPLTLSVRLWEDYYFGH